MKTAFSDSCRQQFMKIYIMVLSSKVTMTLKSESISSQNFKKYLINILHALTVCTQIKYPFLWQNRSDWRLFWRMIYSWYELLMKWTFNSYVKELRHLYASLAYSEFIKSIAFGWFSINWALIKNILSENLSYLWTNFIYKYSLHQ